MVDKPNFHIVSSYERPPVDYVRHDPIYLIRERLNRSLVDRIGDALESRFALGLYVGIYVGSILTVGAALLVSFAS